MIQRSKYLITLFIYHRKAPKKRKMGVRSCLLLFVFIQDIAGVRSCFLSLLIQTQCILMHQIAGDSALFINKQGSAVKSHPIDSRYLCYFHPCNEILICLYESSEISKKQDLTPTEKKGPAQMPRASWIPLGINTCRRQVVAETWVLSPLQEYHIPLPLWSGVPRRCLQHFGGISGQLSLDPEHQL